MSEKDKAYLDELRVLVNRLKYLLDDPQPGLATWAQFYGETMQAISDKWNGVGQVKESPLAYIGD
jgi:hypothetical protein